MRGGMSPVALHVQTGERVRSAMTAAMRANPDAIAAALNAGGHVMDAASFQFVQEGRRLVLGLAAALTTVLRVHRYGSDPHGGDMCLGCGRDDCRTVSAVADVLSAYHVHPAPIDRAEAWRRADAWFVHDTGRVGAILVEEFDAGFIARVAGHDRVLIVDRHTGVLTLWPPMRTDELADHYRRYQRGDL
ncbi:hypothetical protein [Actinomadura fibrosa]|uniref:Uncharacterized protein n=1 Tax=Actinomadura fibrosa TaxID=111802 RepID=A0ABW2XCV3_9ACTN|nr:hypothetical protein [Actinomadura fibrosa]